MSILNKLPIGGGALNSASSGEWIKGDNAIFPANCIRHYAIYNGVLYGFDGYYNSSANKYYGVKYDGTAWTDITNYNLDVKASDGMYPIVLDDKLYIFINRYMYEYNTQTSKLSKIYDSVCIGGYYYLFIPFNNKIFSLSRAWGDSYTYYYGAFYDYKQQTSYTSTAGIDYNGYISDAVEYNNLLYIFLQNSDYSYSFNGISYTQFTLPEYMTPRPVVFRDKIHIFSRSYTNELHYIYDGQSFTRLNDAPYDVHRYACFFVYNDKLHAISEYYQPNHYIYNESDDSFTKVSWLCSK